MGHFWTALIMIEVKPHTELNKIEELQAQVLPALTKAFIQNRINDLLGEMATYVLTQETEKNYLYQVKFLQGQLLELQGFLTASAIAEEQLNSPAQ